MSTVSGVPSKPGNKAATTSGTWIRPVRHKVNYINKTFGSKIKPVRIQHIIITLSLLMPSRGPSDPPAGQMEGIPALLSVMRHDKR